MAAAQQLGDQTGADVAGGAGDEDAHRASMATRAQRPRHPGDRAVVSRRAAPAVGVEVRPCPRGSRARITSTACGFSSTSTNRRPIAAATAPVVPLPAKKSSTQSPGRDDGSSTRRSTPSGFWVG